MILGGYSNPLTEAVVPTVEYLTSLKDPCDYDSPIPALGTALDAFAAPMIWKDPYLLVQGGKTSGLNDTVGE